KRLQRAYGYYLDRGLWDEAANLFAADATLEVGLDGVYVGQRRVREYLRAVGGGRTGLAPGQLGNRATWGEGPYVNEYVKDHGVWKIKSLHWYQTLVVPYHGGWAKNVDVN